MQFKEEIMEKGENNKNNNNTKRRKTEERIVHEISPFKMNKEMMIKNLCPPNYLLYVQEELH
jgi:hypothetical protein